MRLSRGGTHGSGGTGSAARALEWDEFDPRSHGAAWRRCALAVAAVLVFGAIGVVISPAKPAGATVFQSGQVFASVGNSTVNVYDPSSGDLVTSLTDATSQDYTVGSAFDSSGDFYVADDLSGEVSEYSPSGAYTGVFASGLANPISLVFDNQGNLYVGQQQTPYIAEFNSSGQNVANFGPVTTQETGDDWVDLASDECTFYYTTEGNEIFRYNKCTNTQEPVFNQQPLTGANAFQVKILQNGDVLVADSQAVDLLDPNGNLIQTYNCDPTVLPGCSGQLFAIALDPDGTSFWTSDAFSGNIYRIDIATGQLLQTIQTGSPYTYGLSVENELEAATPPQAATVPSTLTIQPVSGNFSHAHTGLRDLDEPEHAGATRQRAGHLHAERGQLGIVYSDDGQYRVPRPVTSRASRAVQYVHAHCVLPGRLDDLGADRVGQHVEHVHGQSGYERTELYRSHLGRERATDHADRDADHGHAHDGHPVADQGGDLHDRLRVDGTVLQRGHRHQWRRELHDPRSRPAADERDGHVDLHR